MVKRLACVVVMLLAACPMVWAKSERGNLSRAEQQAGLRRAAKTQTSAKRPAGLGKQRPATAGPQQRAKTPKSSRNNKNRGW